MKRDGCPLDRGARPEIGGEQRFAAGVDDGNADRSGKTLGRRTPRGVWRALNIRRDNKQG
jgi:hypothetical protein